MWGKYGVFIKPSALKKTDTILWRQEEEEGRIDTIGGGTGNNSKKNVACGKSESRKKKIFLKKFRERRRGRKDIEIDA